MPEMRLDGHELVAYTGSLARRRELGSYTCAKKFTMDISVLMQMCNGFILFGVSLPSIGGSLEKFTT